MSKMKSLTSSSVSFTLSFMTPRCCEISLWYFAAYPYFNLPRLWHQIEDCDSGPSHECHLSRVIFPASDWSVLVNPRLWLVDDMSNVCHVTRVTDTVTHPDKSIIGILTHIHFHMITFLTTIYCRKLFKWKKIRSGCWLP